MFDGTPEANPTSHGEDSFRARLMARRALRPQSTLAIDSGVVLEPGSNPSQQARGAAEAVRDEIRSRAEPMNAVTAPAPAPVAFRSEPPKQAEAPPPPAPSDEELISVIEEIAARKAEEKAAKARQAFEMPAEVTADEIEDKADPQDEAPIPVVVPALAERPEAAPEPREAIEETDEDVGIATRLGDLSQIAFAGLAVLGLAGLSVMAAENALKGPDRPAGTDTNTDAAPALKGGEASAVALAAAVPEEPQAWFNYQGVADMLAGKKAEMDAAAQAAQEEADRLAREQAAKAIADAEAARVAEEQAAAAKAAEDARLAEEAERQRLAEAEAARVAEAEAQRQAELDAERQAAAEAEAKRVAELEAKRKAEAEAEAQRLADAEAQRLARLEAERKAAEEAARKEAFERAKAEEAEKLRLAQLKADQEAAAKAEAVAKAEAERVAAAKLAAETAEAEKLAAQKAASAKTVVASVPAAPAAIVFAPYEGPVPAPASYKPAKPKVLTAAATRAPATVSRAAPATLRADNTNVRSFAAASPQTPETFLANRAQRTAPAPLSDADLQQVQAAFRTVLDTAADGATPTIALADGRSISLVLERTVAREMGQSTVRAVTYTPAVNAVTRVVAEPAPVTVRVMCRDVAYDFAGQEHGRFAACQAPNGGWTLARATDKVKLTAASLPNSAG